jgi:hypothetical protein
MRWVRAGAEHLRTFTKNPTSERQYCDRCGGHLMTNHPTFGLLDVYAATLPDLPFEPALHVNYAETVLRMRDGLPKLKDFPAELGGSGESCPSNADAGVPRDRPDEPPRPAAGDVPCFWGSVNQWECDENDHLNVRFYAHKVHQAIQVLLAQRGGLARRPPPPAPGGTLHIRFLREARSATPLRIDCAPVRAADGTSSFWPHAPQRQRRSAGGFQVTARPDPGARGSPDGHGRDSRVAPHLAASTRGAMLTAPPPSLERRWRSASAWSAAA